MAPKTVDVTLPVGGTFTPGTSVEAHPRVVDTLATRPITKAVAKARVGNDGNAIFKGLVPNGAYFAIGDATVVKPRRDNPGLGTEEVKEFRSIAFTANSLDMFGQDGPDTGTQASYQQYLAEQAAGLQVREGQPQGAGTPTYGDRQIVTGARGTANVRTSKAADEPQPHPRIEDMSDSTPLRSATPTGSAHPVQPGEPQPKPTQDDVAKSTPQRSQTERGEAEITEAPEATPNKRQEDESGPQRSQTETGAAEPKPRTSSPAKQQKARDASKSKARGVTKAKAGTSKKSSRASARKSSGARTASQSKSGPRPGSRKSTSKRS